MGGGVVAFELWFVGAFLFFLVNILTHLLFESKDGNVRG